MSASPLPTLRSRVRLPRTRSTGILLALTLILSPATWAAKNRPDSGASPTQPEPFLEILHSDFGYRLDLTDTDWYRWPDVSDHVSHPDLGGERWQGAFASVPACFPDWQPSAHAVHYALVRSIGHEYPTPGARNQQTLDYQGATLHSWEATQIRDGELSLRFRYHIIERGNCAHLLSVWTTLDDNALDKMATELIDGLTLTPIKTGLAPEAQAWFYNAAGLYFHNAENYVDAVEGFRRAAELDPGDTTYITNTTSTYNNLNRYQQGLEFLLQPGVADNRNPIIQTWQGWFEYHTGDFEAAVNTYEAAVAQSAVSEDDLYAYTHSLLQLNQVSRADRVLDTHGATDPGISLVQALVEVAQAKGEHQEALNILEDAEQRGVRANALNLTRMDILGAMGDYAAVVAFSDQLIAQGLGSALVYNYRGDAEYQLERYQDAKASFEQSLALQPGDASTVEYLRYTNAQLGKGDSSSISTPIAPVAFPELAAPERTRGIEGYDSHLPLSVTAYHYDPEKPLKTTHLQHIRVHDQSGVNRYSTLMARFNPLAETLYVNRLSVFDDQGQKVSDLDRTSLYIGDAEDYDQSTFGKVVRAPVAGLAPGYRIEFMYTLEQRSAAERFDFERLYLSGQRPIGLSALYIEGELDDLLYNQTNTTKPESRANALLWTVNNPTPALREPMQVDNAEFMSSVVLVSENNWRTAGEDYRKRVDELILAESPELAPLVEELTAGLNPGDTGARIAALASYVQQTLTYKALEFGVRGYTPNPPSQILQDRFGDCKDHSVLLWRLLREADIPAELALANLSGPVDPDMPSIDQFDHMIVYLPEWNGGTFIDATNKNIDLLGVAPDGLGGTWTLTMGEQPSLVQVPALNPSRIDIHRSLTAQPNGETQVQETLSMSAYFASSLRGHFKDIEPRERLNWVQRFLGDNGRPVIVESMSVDNLNDAEKELILKLSYRVGRSATQRSRAAVIDPAYWERYYLSSHYVHDRQTDFEVAYPLQLTSRVTYPVDDHRTPEPVADQQDESRFGRFQSTANAGSDALTHHFDYQIDAGRYSADEYSAFQAFTLNAIDALARPMTLEIHPDQATR